MPEIVNVAVIIPFFQREKGILARALHSIESQVLPSGVVMTVIVVDDASPVPAAEELHGFALDEPHRLVLMQQQNTGPGGARNSGLDRAESVGCAFVAFLDSDDEWLPLHLATALQALGGEHDFYFCNHTRFNTEQSWFDEVAPPKFWRQHPAGNLTPIASTGDAYVVDRDVALQAFLVEYMSQTSTVVFRFTPANRHRFDVELRGAGEDHMFWIELCKSSRSVVLCYTPSVYCGRGVNIYYSAFDWTNVETVNRYGYILMFLIKVYRSFPEECRPYAKFQALLDRHTRAYAFLFVRALLLNMRPSASLLGKLFRLSPQRVVGIPIYFVGVVVRRQRQEVFSWS